MSRTSQTWTLWYEPKGCPWLSFVIAFMNAFAGQPLPLAAALLLATVLGAYPLLGLGAAGDGLLAVLSSLTLVLGVEFVVVGGCLHVLGLGSDGPALAVVDVAVPVLVAVVAAFVAEAHDCGFVSVYRMCVVM